MVTVPLPVIKCPVSIAVRFPGPVGEVSPFCVRYRVKVDGPLAEIEMVDKSIPEVLGPNAPELVPAALPLTVKPPAAAEIPKAVFVGSLFRRVLFTLHEN